MENPSFNVIIPCAKIVCAEMESEFGKIPSGLVPINGRIVLEEIIRQYDANPKAHFYIGISESAELVEDYFNFFPNERVHLVRVGVTRSFSETIRVIAEHFPFILENPIVINFADTVVTDPDTNSFGRDFLCWAQTIETERWTLFKNDDNIITEFSDKHYQVDASEWKTFVGVFGIHNTRLFYDIFINSFSIHGVEPFFAAIKEYYRRSTGAHFYNTKGWLDFGHVDNYYLARKDVISRRFFNNLTFRDSHGTITKTSTNATKLIDEINWFLNVPAEFKYYLPQIFGYSVDPGHPFLEMEFCSSSPLDESFVYSKFDLDVWEKIFTKIFSLIRTASGYKLQDGHLRDSLKEMYYTKTIERINEFANSPAKEIINRFLSNNRYAALFDSLPTALSSLIDKAGVCETDTFQIIHGDLCLGNILYDPKHSIIKLIDMRGRFGRHTIYGDVYYDLAKLSHSILGFYDLIMLGQYRIEKVGDDITVKWRTSEYHHAIGKMFLKYLRTNGFDLDRIRFIESLLFLSMIPLHKDHPERQKVMALRGMQIMCEALDKIQL